MSALSCFMTLHCSDIEALCKVCVAEIHYAALTEQLLKRLRHLKVIIKRDYMNYQPTYQHTAGTQCKDTHTQLCTNTNKTPTHTSTGTTIQQHTGNLSKCSKFILAAKTQESWNIHAESVETGQSSA